MVWIHTAAVGLLVNGEGVDAGGRIAQDMVGSHTLLLCLFNDEGVDAQLNHVIAL